MGISQQPMKQYLYWEEEVNKYTLVKHHKLAIYMPLANNVHCMTLENGS
jgi:hypothetical protein